MISFLNTLYGEGLLATQRDIAGPHRLWTFIALLTGNGKIKVSTKTEMNLYYVLLLAYYANQKFVSDGACGKEPTTDIRALMRYFRSATSKEEAPVILWPECNEASASLTKMFGEQAEALGVAVDGLSKEEKSKAREKAGRERLQAVVGALCVWFAPTLGEE